MDASERQQIQVKDINAERRPHLAEALSIVEGTAYLLSSERLSDDPEDTRLVVFIISSNINCIIEDTPSYPESGADEYYHATLLDDTSIVNLRKIIATPSRIRKESTGRPPKYSVELDGTDIFIQYVYEDQSIKAIAKEHHMSPTTVQKLLNKSRLTAAENFLNGTWQMSRDSLNWEKNLNVIRWAIKHTDGNIKQAYQNFLKTLY